MPENCAPQEPPKGIGDLVRICPPLRNTTDTTGTPLPITVTIPPGFVVVAEDPHTQNGVLAQKQTVLIEPGRTINLPLHLFCLNNTRSGSSPQDTFQPGPILQYADFQELFDLLQDKELNRDAPRAELQGRGVESVRGRSAVRRGPRLHRQPAGAQQRLKARRSEGIRRRCDAV